MKEKLIIQNFGPIKSVELELGRFNVLIGDQGTGKSTVAKVLLAIKNTYFRELLDLKDRDTTVQFKGHIELVGLENFFYQDTGIEYSCKYFDFTFKNGKAEISEKEDVSVDRMSSYDFTYIPSERNLVVTLSDALYTLIESKINLPSLFLRFGNKFQTARSKSFSRNHIGIIGGEYTYENNSDWVTLKNGMKIPLKDSSTGMQGSLVLLNVFDYVISSQKENLLVIEEPELNLFPSTQNRIMQHFVDRTMNGTNATLITTHSPYTLTSLNNMMYAYELGQKNGSAVEKIIDKKFWLNPSEVSVYKMLDNGTCEDIMDYDESGTLIKADKIDGVSRTLNKIFDDLIEIEHANSTS